MDRISALQFYVRVVDSGSFSQAARDLGVGQPAVSKQIAALEQRLGTQLLSRTSRGLRPTPAGTDFYETAVRLIGDLDELEARVTGGQVRPAGSVRIAAPPTLTSMMLVPRLAEFYASFPDVTVEVSVSERHADLVQEGLDMAIRVGNLDDSGLVARRIGSMQIATVASPAYLASHGAPTHPSDLDRHRLLTSRYRGGTNDWFFRNVQGVVRQPVSGVFSSNDPADLHAAVLAGLGIAQSARAHFEAQLKCGEVIELLPDFVPDAFPIHLLYASSRTPHRVRVLGEFIACVLDGIPGLRNI